MDKLERTVRLIKEAGFLSRLQLELRLAQIYPGINEDEVCSLLEKLPSKEIHRIEYTNSYVSALKSKALYYYNPNHKQHTRKRKRKVTSKKKQA